MSDSNSLLATYYQRFLQTGHSATFAESVAGTYTLATLEKLLYHNSAVIRRGASLAIGFLGDYSCNAALGMALNDDDRGVRMIAEHGIRHLWFRDGHPAQRKMLERCAWLNRCGKHEHAVELCERVLDQAPRCAEALHQKGLALASLYNHQQAMESREKAIEINPFHFVAHTGQATSFLEMDDLPLAICSFRQALLICPGLENVRAQIDRLERITGSR